MRITRLRITIAAWLLAWPARALDKQVSAHAAAVEGPDDGVDLSGALLVGGAFYNPSYPARPDNSGLALGRAALHADADLIGRRLSIPIDIDVFTDGTRRGAAVLAPSELDVIGGVTSTWRVRPGALEIGVRGEQDLPVDREGLIQSYVDARVRYLYSVAAVRPSFGAALGDGDLSGWFTVGYFAINQTYAARPDLSGLALFRYQAHAELSLWRDIVSFALDANLFTDRRSSDVVAPSELDLTPELILRRAPLEFHVAFESDMPIDRPGAPQSFAYALVSYSFELSGRPPHPLETKELAPHGH